MPHRKNHLPDPNTNKHRYREYNPKDGLHIPRKKIIEHVESKSKGINLKLMGRAIRAPEVIARKGKRANLSDKQILQKQEQLVSRIASKYVDHLISGMKEKGLVEHNISPREERKLWIQTYDEFVENFFLHNKGVTRIDEQGKIKFIWERLTKNDKEAINLRRKIIDEMDRSINFVLPPKFIIERRMKRSKYNKKSWDLIRKNVKPVENLKEEVSRILKRKYSKPNRKYTDEQVKRAKALHVCLAVSIYADMMERTRGENWTTAYTDGMLIISPQIEKRKDIEEIITNMDKVDIEK